jgi:REP element-mobilizing transposase RayT
MVHSIDSAPLFKDNEDCEKMLGLLDRYLPKHRCRCYGFAFEDNHLHLILRPSGDKDDFSRMIQCIDSMYSRYYNKKYQRRGYLFWDRPKTKPTRDLHYLHQLVIYVHRNPVRSGKVKNPEELRNYHRTSHRYLFTQECPHKWLHTAYMKALLMMGTRNRSNYLNEYVMELFDFDEAEFDPWKEPNNRAEPLPNGPDKYFRSEWRWIRAAVQMWERRMMKRKRFRKVPDHLSKLAVYCSRQYGLHANLTCFKSACGEYRSARALFLYWAITVGGYSAVLIGRSLGISQSTALRGAREGERLAVEFPF